MADKKTKAERDLLQQIRRPDLSILGRSIKKLSPMQWQERMLFAGVSDRDLKEWTGGFPATFRKQQQTHPLFVLFCRASGHFVCPCSSKGGAKLRYIRKGCRLEMKEKCTDRNSFLIEYFSFTLPLDSRFRRPPLFLGKVPPCCIVGGR